MSKQTPLSPTEAASILGCSRQYVHALIKASRIKGAFRVGKHWAIPQPVTITERK